MNPFSISDSASIFGPINISDPTLGVLLLLYPLHLRAVRPCMLQLSQILKKTQFIKEMALETIGSLFIKLHLVTPL